ncbi:MAG: hypothetical protein ACYTFI_22115, partial [Planctomycetota bacterium]
EGKKARTTVAYTVFDRLPLIAIQREVHLGKRGDNDAKRDGKKDDKRPTEPIDEVMMVGVSFRAAFRPERDGGSGSRVLSVDGDRFAALRYGRTHDMQWNTWRLTEGWAVMEHPGRRECMMYLFDGANAPELRMWLSDHTVTLEPEWLQKPLRPEGGTGFAVAVTGGEICGADVRGAWVACRKPISPAKSTGGVECALVARFREEPKEATAAFRLGGARAEARLERMLLPDTGAVYVATARLPRGTMKAKLDVTAGGIPARGRR